MTPPYHLDRERDLSLDLAHRADFYLMLSRAFLPPAGASDFLAMREHLSDDLADAARLAGYPVGPAIEDLRAALAGLPHGLALLQTYSSLFVQPPRPVPINAALFLDGAVMGRSVDALEQVFRNHGMERSESFRDTPDHLALLLEFLAYRYARAAEDGSDAPTDIQAFLRAFLLSWVPPFARRLGAVVEETGLNPTYLHLARILQAALIHDAGEIPEALWAVIEPARGERLQAREREMARCRRCGADIAPAGRLRRVKKVLEKEGIDTAHLDLCLDCRGSPEELLARLSREQA